MKGLLFTYLLTYGGAAASLVNPFVGLLVYICFANIRPESLWFWSVPPGPYSRIVALALLAGWALNGFGNWNFGRGAFVIYSLLAYWAWSVICASIAPVPEVAWGFVESQSKIFLPVLVGMTLIDSVERLKQLTWTIILSQGYVAYDLNRAYYDGFNRLQVDGFGGMDNNCVSIGMVTVAGFAFFFGLRERSWWKKLLCFGAAALMVHCCMFAFSRGAMLGLCVMGGVSFYFVARQPKHWWALAVAMVVAFSLAGPEVVERFVSAFAEKEERDASAQSRVEMWGSCWQLMLESPLVGCGPDHWPLQASRFGWPSGKEAHTLWLQLGAEMGFPGLLFLLSFYGSCSFLLWRLWEDRHNHVGIDPWLVDTAPMIIAALSGFVVSAQFVTLEGLEVPYYVTLIGAGTLKLAYHPAPAGAIWLAPPPPTYQTLRPDASSIHG